MTRCAPLLILLLDLLIFASYLVLMVFAGWDTDAITNGLSFALFPIAGAVILRQQPRNAVGWVLAAIGLTVTAGSLVSEYAIYGYHHPALGLPFIGAANWVSLFLWSFAYPCIVLLLLLFPDGRLPSPGWRFLLILTLLAQVPVYIAQVAIALPNRMLLFTMGEDMVPSNPVLIPLFQMYTYWSFVMFGCIVLALVSFFLRYHRSEGVERMQLKWFVYGMSIIPVSILLDEIVARGSYPLLDALNDVFSPISIVIFPITLLIAITRYRLYDIDFLIRRTLLYSAVTVTLGLIYFASVFLMQTAFTRSFGQQSPLIVVFSTLLIAALFQPLRRRFQAVIDRRFYRSKYDTEQTLARFSEQIKHQVDVQTIHRSLVSVIDSSIQPESVELWIVKK